MHKITCRCRPHSRIVVPVPLTRHHKHLTLPEEQIIQNTHIHQTGSLEQPVSYSFGPKYLRFSSRKACLPFHGVNAYIASSSSPFPAIWQIDVIQHFRLRNTLTKSYILRRQWKRDKLKHLIVKCPILWFPKWTTSRPRYREKTASATYEPLPPPPPSHLLWHVPNYTRKP